MLYHYSDLRDSSLKLVKLCSNQRFLCASPNYLKLYGAPEIPEQLLDHQCIALRENYEDVTLWRFQHDKSKEEHSVRVIPKLASNEGSVVKQWALNDLGIIMRSEWDVRSELNHGSLVRLLPHYSLPNADIVALLGSEANTRTAKTQAFLEYLKTKVAEQPWLNQ